MSLSHPADVQKEREASKHRLLDVWSTLAERYTRRLDEDDIVDIRTGEILIDRGFIRKSRKVDFGAIAAPAAEDAIVDEGTDEDGKDFDEEGEDDDELDAFADTNKPVLSVTALDSADAEDLRAFLEAESRRKDLCGSDVEVEEDDSSLDQNQESGVVEHEIVDLVSEDELDNWDVDDSSVVYPLIKQEYSDIEIVEGPTSISPQAESTTESQHEILQESPRKRKRVSSETSLSDLPCQGQPPTVYEIPGELKHILTFLKTYVVEVLDIIDNTVVKSISSRRSDSRSQRPRPTAKLSVSGSGSESGNSSDSEQEYNRKPSRSHRNNFQFPYHYPYPHHPQSYLPSPHRKQQQHQQHHHPPPPPPPEMFMPPIPDPRAQYIITQAMHQLSSLVGSPWAPPHDSSFTPHTPSRRHQSRRANSVFNTPYHPHPYPYSYDPNFSLATLPPESPELISSPEKLSHGPRKSLIARARSHSRGRRVSFKTDQNSDRDDVYSSPSKPCTRREVAREHNSTTRPFKGKGTVRAETPDSEYFKTDRGSDRDDVYSSPSKPRTRPGREVAGEHKSTTRPSKGRGTAKAETPDSEYFKTDRGSDLDDVYSSPSKPRTGSGREVAAGHKSTTRPSKGKGTARAETQGPESFKTDRGSDGVDVFSSPSKPCLRREVAREQSTTRLSKGKGTARAGTPVPESFRTDRGSDGVDVSSSPPKPRLRRKAAREQPTTKPPKRKRTARAETPDSESLKTDRGSDRDDVYSSPSRPRSRRAVVMEHKSTTRPSKGKGTARAETPDSESSPENPLNCGSERDDRKSYLRGRTPGPKIGFPKGIKPGHDSKRRLRGVLEAA